MEIKTHARSVPGHLNILRGAVVNAEYPPATGVQRATPSSHIHGAYVGLASDALDVQKLQAEHLYGSPWAGAISTFTGLTRCTSNDEAHASSVVGRMSYEAYSAVALEEMLRIVEHIYATFDDVRRVVLVHRIGVVELAEAAVFVGVASAHRRASLDAVNYAIEEIKRRVPIWKTEYFEAEVHLRDVAEV